MVRLTLSDVVKRRLLRGDISVHKDALGYFLNYDSIVVSRVGRELELELREGKVVIASINYDLDRIMSGGLIELGGLEGRMRVQADNELPAFIRNKHGHF
jgi:hypothetical protein